MKKLFGHPESGHAFKVRFFLCAAGIEHQYEKIDIFQPRELRPPEFQSVARFGEVPVLLDDERVIVQSNAILLHLAQQSGRWGGESAQRQIQCAEWLVWEANKIGMCLPQLRSRLRFGSDEALDGAFAWLSARYEHDVKILDDALVDGRLWILDGDSPTIADFSLCGYLFYASEAKVTVPRNVQAWLDRLAGLEGFQPPAILLD